VETRQRIALEAVAIGLAAFAVRLANLDHTPYVDELNHLMAAASLLSEGAPLIVGDYEYTRARLMTWLVAGSYLLFGEGLVPARIPALLAGTALVVAAFLWVRQAAGAWEGWTAGVLLMFAPQAIYHSQLARFYSFQALFMLGVAWVVWVLVREAGWVTAEGGGGGRLGPAPPSLRRIMTLVGVGVLCVAGALHMQLSSIVGVGAAGTWLLAVVGVAGLRGSGSRKGGDRDPGAREAGARESRSGRRSKPLLAAAGVVAAGGLVLLWFQMSGQLSAALAAFGRAGIWAEGQAGNVRYYHNSLLHHYPLLWAPFPAIALVALVRRPALSSLWLAVFGLILGVQSLAAWKADRYIFYALPFFFMVTGLVVGPLIRRLWEEVTALGVLVARRLTGWNGVLEGARPGDEPGAPRWARVAAGAVLVPVLLFAGWGNPASSYTGRMVFGSDATWPFEIKYRGEPDWAGVAEDLRDRIAEVEIVISSTELKALYFLGRNDLILSVNYLGREASGELREPFTMNWKSDTPMIARPETLEAVIECRRSGLILIEDNHWGQGWSNPPELTETIERRARRIDLAPGRRVHAFEWDHEASDAPTGFRCSDLPEVGQVRYPRR